MGKEGVNSLKEFVNQGGTLVALGDCCEFAIDKLELNVRNVVAELDSKEYFCPGSTLKVTFKNCHPLAYGMPSEGLVLLWSNPVFEIIPHRKNQDYETIVRYKERDILRSGWLIGEKHISHKPAMINAQYGSGQVILIGFRTQHRCQTHTTFKLLFNTLLK